MGETYMKKETIVKILLGIVAVGLVIAGVVYLLSQDSEEIIPEQVQVQDVVLVDDNSCGNTVCEKTNGETDRTCPSDCVRTCGNGVCEQDVDETVGRYYPEHYQVCGDCAPEVCGDGLCRFYETAYMCPEDCG